MLEAAPDQGGSLMSDVDDSAEIAGARSGRMEIWTARGSGHLDGFHPVATVVLGQVEGFIRDTEQLVF